MTGGASTSGRASVLMHAARLVLTNGASISISAPTKRAGALFAAFDVFNHNLWKQNKVKTEAMIQAEQDFLPDFSAFYSRRGGSRSAAPAAASTAAAAAPVGATGAKTASSSKAGAVSASAPSDGAAASGGKRGKEGK